MDTKIQVFENTEFGKIRAIEIDGNPWFVGKDVATTLGYVNPAKALQDHVDEDDKLNNKSLLSLGQRGGWIINESGLYSLVLLSKLPTAKKFKRWVTFEVLPSIRQHGAYITDDVLDQLIENPEAAMKLFAKLKDERARKEALEQYVSKLTPKARYYDIILQCPGAVLATVIAKDYGMSAIKFNKLLHALGVQFRYKTNKTWVLYQEHDNKGYTVSNTYYINGTTHIQMCWTQKGRFWLYEYLKAHGVYPKTEQPTQLQLSEPPVV